MGVLMALLRRDLSDGTDLLRFQQIRFPKDCSVLVKRYTEIYMYIHTLKNKASKKQLHSLILNSHICFLQSHK